MVIDPFIAGVLTALFAEMAALIIYSIFRRK